MSGSYGYLYKISYLSRVSSQCYKHTQQETIGDSAITISPQSPLSAAFCAAVYIQKKNETGQVIALKLIHATSRTVLGLLNAYLRAKNYLIKPGYSFVLRTAI